VRSLAAVAATSASACAGLDWDLNPFYVGNARVTERGAESRATSAGPFWDDTRTPDRRETAFHPLWRRVATSTETRAQVLDPLFAARWTADESSYRFLALSWAKTHSSGSTSPDTDFMFFPIFWFGRGPREEENYFAFFPLFGTIKTFMGFSEMSFFLFPLYYRAMKNITEPETFYSLTPFIGWVDGGPRDGSWHLLPIAGHWQYEGKYDKWSVLWPFVHWQRNDLDTSDPTRDVTVWPLFGIETGKRKRYLTFLWPFFRFKSQRYVETDAQGLPYEEVYFRNDYLWPFFQREHTREFDRLRLFPFYAHYESPEISSQAWAVPLFWLREVREPGERGWTKRTFDFVPFVHHEAKEFRDGRAPDGMFKLWPLFSTKSEAGVDETKVIALLPMDVERYTSDFEANWGPLFELYRNRRTADGDRDGAAAFRLVQWSATGDERRFSLPLLASARWDDRRWRSDLLLGLIRIGGGAGGAELRLLGLPLLTPEVVAK